jgi:hypothetical protein
MTKQFANRLFVILGLLLGSFALSQAVIVGSLPYTLTNGSTADASQVMANYNKIITDVNANAAHNGVNSDITALTALSTPLTVAQGGTAWFTGGTSTGSANAQVTASVVPTGMTLAAGQGVCFNAGFTNTGATTLVANGLTAKNVFRQSPSGNQALTGGEIVSGSYTCAQYDGTQYVLRTSGYLAPGVGPLTNLASATGTTPGTDLGTIATHNVNITGTNTISAFCNAASCTASTTYPEYQLTFAGALTLTHNATSLILPGGANITTVANDTATAVYLGSGNWRVKNYQHVATAPTGQLQGVQYFTASGTWTRPTGVNSVIFVCTGGGGGGGGSATSGGTQASSGGGGGAGGWAQLYKTAPATSYTITLGTGGTGVSASTGNNGTATTVGAILTCNGGSGGTSSTASNQPQVAVGGVGGTATSGDLNITGAIGVPGVVIENASGNAVGALGGNGGATQLAPGGSGSVLNSASSAVGGNAAFCGAGGGGAATVQTATSRAGGAGSDGCVVAYAYY